MPRIALLLALAVAAAALDLAVVPDRADGAYRVGEAVTWTVTASGAAPPAGLRWRVRAGSLVEIAAGDLVFADGAATVTARLGEPGTLLLEIPLEGGRRALGGAAVDWPRIAPSAPEPVDFDAFWKDKFAELAAVPADPQLTAVDSGHPGVQLWKLGMANVRGTRIHGYLARPAGDAPCPAMLAVQYAGVYPLQKEWSVGPAAQGWLVLNLIAHDLPVDAPAETYAAQRAGALRNYPHLGRDDRDASYFLRMYLSCRRGADYLVGRADWDQKTLLAQGGSQGGLQAIVAAALHPQVSVVTANVPAGCDHAGAAARRAPGWPRWVNEDPRTLAASGYYDAVHFARRVRCPTLVGLGLVDTVCPPPGVFALFNQLAGPKRLALMPTAGHLAPHPEYHAAMMAWWLAAREGRALPLR